MRTIERERERRAHRIVHFRLLRDYASASPDGIYFPRSTNRIAARLDLEPVGVINLPPELRVQGRPPFPHTPAAPERAVASF